MKVQIENITMTQKYENKQKLEKTLKNIRHTKKHQKLSKT